jgi:hypothetical protein
MLAYSSLNNWLITENCSFRILKFPIFLMDKSDQHEIESVNMLHVALFYHLIAFIHIEYDN